MAQSQPNDITDLTSGWYRRQYSGYGTGRRINAVSLGAEAWFWRVHSIAADDFGNAPSDPELVYLTTKGRRADVTVDQVRDWLAELVRVELVRPYESHGECYMHVDGFVARQPAGRNGKRVRRFPQSPWDEMEERGMLVSPGDSSAPNPIPNPNPRSKPAAQVSGEPADAASPVFLTFPTVPGRNEGATTWDLCEAFVDRLAHGFPGVDIRAEARKALLWAQASPGKRKTAGGMERFLFGWMERAQNRGGRPSNGQASTPAERNRERKLARLDERLKQ